jgi:probable HAF family extracellular repeat protein
VVKAGHPGQLVAGLAATLVLVIGAPAEAAETTADRTLRLIRLDTGGLSGQIVEINARGQVLGHLQYPDGPTRPALWHRYDALPELGFSGDFPYGLNDRGDVLVDTGIWRNGRVDPLTRPSGRASGVDINNRRQVAGILSNDSPYTTTAFRWQDGRFTDLGAPAGTTTLAVAINERGDLLGLVIENMGPVVDTFIWRDGIKTLLGHTLVTDLNDRGQIIGNRSAGESGLRPYLWHRGRTTDLMAGHPDQEGVVWDINNAGDVVGRMGSRPFLWRARPTRPSGPCARPGQQIGRRSAIVACRRESPISRFRLGSGPKGPHCTPPRRRRPRTSAVRRP